MATPFTHYGVEHIPKPNRAEQLKARESAFFLSSITDMVFRLPSHIDTFVPPPTQQLPSLRPWRGTLVVRGMRPSDRSSSQEIRVTAVETDGLNRADLWPPQFFTQIIHRPILPDLQLWVKRQTPPLCTFMPDRHRDPNINTVNQTNFRSLSRILFESQTVAIASWGSDAIPGAGIIIFPAQNSSSLLVGALFLNEPFPSFVVGNSPPPAPMVQMQLAYGAQYQQPTTSYATSSRHHHSASPQQQMLYPGSPVEDPGSENRQQQPYPYLMPRTYSSDRPNEEGGSYNTSQIHEAQNYPRSG